MTQYPIWCETNGRNRSSQKMGGTYDDGLVTRIVGHKHGLEISVNATRSNPSTEETITFYVYEIDSNGVRKKTLNILSFPNSH